MFGMLVIFVCTLLQDEAASWEMRLSTLLEGLALLQAIQRRWLYLGPIFSRGALPAIAGRFRHVDGEFRAIMAQLQVSCTSSLFKLELSLSLSLALSIGGSRL
jgi:hypothetical protein